MSIQEMVVEIQTLKNYLGNQGLGLIEQEEHLVALLALQDSLISALIVEKNSKKAA